MVQPLLIVPMRMKMIWDVEEPEEEQERDNNNRQ